MIMEITLTHLESVWNPSGPSEVPKVLLKPVTGQELVFAVSYSKPALAAMLFSLLTYLPRFFYYGLRLTFSNWVIC